MRKSQECLIKALTYEQPDKVPLDLGCRQPVFMCPVLRLFANIWDFPKYW